MFASRRDNLKELLEPIKRRLLLRQIIRGVARSSLLAMGAGVLFLFTARLFPIPYYLSWTISLFALAIGGGVTYTLCRPPTWEAAARVADRLGLSERVMTAWENRENSTKIAAMQREDAVRRIRRQLPEILQQIPVWEFTRRQVVLYGGVAGIWLLLLFLPNSMDGILHERELTAKVTEAVEKKLEEAVKEAKKNDKLTEQQKQQLTDVLEDLKEELEAKESLVEQLNSLEKAEKELLAIQEREIQKQNALLQMQQKLEQNEALQDIAEALAKEDQEALFTAMKEISKLLESFSVEQKEELARLLEEMAEMAIGSEGGKVDLKQIAENLKQAAENLRGGDLPQSFEEMKEAFVQAMQQNTQVQNMGFQMAGALAALQQSQMSLGQTLGNNSQGSGMASQGNSGTPGAASPSHGTPGSTPENGQGQSTGSGSNAAQVPGIGQGQGSGSGSSQGQGQGNGSGNGGMGAGAGGTGAGLGTGSHELVNVPSERIVGDGPTDTVGGPIGEGASETRQSSQAQVSPGVARPYEEVFQQYEQFARDSLDRQLIPSDYQEIVKEYFTQIEP